jgi:PAS domain S-box-containing protein
VLILSPIALWFLTSAVLAVGVAVLLASRRRHERAVSELSAQVAQLSREADTVGRIGLKGKPQALEQLGAAVNQLLESLEQRGARLHDREQLFQRLVETVHDAVLVYRKSILFANARFLAMLGRGAADVVGKSLSEFVAPEYVELVESNLRRRLAGEAGHSRRVVEHADRQCGGTRAAAHCAGDAADLDAVAGIRTAPGDGDPRRNG